MRWLGTGGTGFLGISLVRRLVSRSDEVGSLVANRSMSGAHSVLEAARVVGVLEGDAMLSLCQAVIGRVRRGGHRI